MGSSVGESRFGFLFFASVLFVSCSLDLLFVVVGLCELSVWHITWSLLLLLCPLLLTAVCLRSKRLPYHPVRACDMTYSLYT